MVVVVRADVEQDGTVQMFSSDDRERHQFEDVTLAWEDQDFLERLAELVAGDRSLYETVDWIVVEVSGRYTLDQWRTFAMRPGMVLGRTATQHARNALPKRIVTLAGKTRTLRARSR